MQLHPSLRASRPCAGSIVYTKLDTLSAEQMFEAYGPIDLPREQKEDRKVLHGQG